MTYNPFPIKLDRLEDCSVCKCRATHQITVYPDAEYRVCTRCKARTTIDIKADQQETRKANRSWADDLDFKRNHQRRYKKRR